MAAAGGPASIGPAARLAERPELDPHWLAPLYNAFHLLSRGRPVGMAPGGIPTPDILWMAAQLDEPPLPFLRLMRELDAVYLEHCRPESPSSAES